MERPNAATFIILDGAVAHISPIAYDLLLFLLKHPAGQYFTGELRHQLQTCATRNLRPYFKELQSLGLLEPVFVHGRVLVSKLAACVGAEYGMPVFERVNE